MRISKDFALNAAGSYISLDTAFLRHNTHLHVAILMKRGKILEVATNSIGSRSKGSGYDTRTIHAERAVLKKVGDISKIRDSILIVFRLGKGTKDLVNSEPCHSCRCHLEKCIRDYGLKQVYYS
jgi:hypothetical protein